MFALKGRTSTFKVLTVSADGNSADILAIGSGLWETVCMSEKRTKADKGQREADQLEKKSSHRPPQNQGKKHASHGSSRSGSPSRLSDPLHQRLRRLRFLYRRADCYRVERTSSRAGLAPAEDLRLSRRTAILCYRLWVLKKSVTRMSFGHDYRCCRVFSSPLS